MWFKTVPRLGAFMAIPIVYNSCLSDEALDAAIADFIKVTAENQSLKQQQAEWEKERELKAEAAKANGETLDEEVKVVEYL